MITKDREYRTFDIQTRSENDEMIVEGYAITFNQPTCLYEYDGVKYYEEIDARALDNAKMDDVVFVFNHEGKPMARTRNKTLELKADEHGLFIRANIGGTEEGRKLYEEIKGGYIDKMSFAFTYDKNEYDRKERKNLITGISRLFDVSAVTFPAYDTTSINARSRNLFELENSKERLEKRNKRINEVKIELLKARLEN